jgi:hypothetical protein
MAMVRAAERLKRRILHVRRAQTTMSATMYFAFFSLGALVALGARMRQPRFGPILATCGRAVVALALGPTLAFVAPTWTPLRATAVAGVALNGPWRWGDVQRGVFCPRSHGECRCRRC